MQHTPSFPTTRHQAPLHNIPHISSCISNFTSILHLLFNSRGDYIILGDFNAHIPVWYSRKTEPWWQIGVPHHRLLSRTPPPRSPYLSYPTTETLLLQLHNSLPTQSYRFYMIHPHDPQLRPRTNPYPTGKLFRDELPRTSLSHFEQHQTHPFPSKQ